MSEYQDVLRRVRAWVPTYGHQFDIWRPRWDLAEQTPDAHTKQGSLAQDYMNQVLRAVNALVDEGVLVKQGSHRDARYMTPEVQLRYRQENAEAAEQRAAIIQRWARVYAAYSAAGLAEASNMMPDGSVELGLEQHEKLISIYLDDGEARHADNR